MQTKKLILHSFGDSEVDLLQKMAKHVFASAPLHELLIKVVEFASDAVKCDSCFIYVLENDELVLRASKNSNPEVVNRLKPKFGEGITGWAASHREPVVVSQNACDDPRFRLFNELPKVRFESFLSVPVVSRSRLVGVMNLQTKVPRQYSNHEMKLILTIGLLVGSEVEMARLESENSQLADELETRKIVERAKGILQREISISEQEAYLALQRESCRTRKPMKDVAEAIVASEEFKRSLKEANSAHIPPKHA